jgi:hypothetical protein
VIEMTSEIRACPFRSQKRTARLGCDRKLGAVARGPLFGINFQSVYFGQSLNEPGVGSGGTIRTHSPAVGIACPLWLPRQLSESRLPILSKYQGTG